MPFCTFEGIEGSGKSTQAARFAARFGARALLTREPGGTELGRGVRELLLAKHPPVAAAAESLLFFADRAQHVSERLRPALAEGRVVVCDRYVESSLAYQGYGRGLDLEALHRIGAFATGGLRPDLILLLDLPVEAGLARARSRAGGPDRLEAEDVAFHERVRAGYHAMAAADPARWRVVDARGGEDEVAERVAAAAGEWPR
ncbi:MAG: dTMP kinase [Vicinamibacteria bacterium]|nr:dTMP kinase [Vicinamibacteria bacterium]